MLAIPKLLPFLTLFVPAIGLADGIPQRVGDCVDTAVKEVGFRLSGDPDSGDQVLYTNGEAQVSYKRIRGAGLSRPGDRVRMCLTFVPKKCPKDDPRGRVYRVTNLRTGKVWSAPNSSHSCGGA